VAVKRESENANDQANPQIPSRLARNRSGVVAQAASLKRSSHEARNYRLPRRTR
jgi:hypothetical protein